MALPQLVLLGDSITQGSWGPEGWGSLLAARYVRRADVVNRGFSGYNTRWIQTALPAILGSGVRVSGGLVILFLGANDSAQPPHNVRQHVPITEECRYEHRLGEIAHHIRKTGGTVIIVTPPPVDPEAWSRFLQNKGGLAEAPAPDRNNATTKLYADAAIRAARANDCPVVDLWRSMQAAAPKGEWKAMLSDGLHLSATGNRHVYEELCSTISTKCPQFAVDLQDNTGINADTKSPLENLLPWHNYCTEDTDLSHLTPSNCGEGTNTATIAAVILVAAIFIWRPGCPGGLGSRIA